MCQIPIQCHCSFTATDSSISTMVVNRNMVQRRILIHTLSRALSKGGAVSRFDCMSDSFMVLQSNLRNSNLRAYNQKTGLQTVQVKIYNRRFSQQWLWILLSSGMWCHVIFFFVRHTVAVDFQICLWISNIHMASHPRRWYALQSSD
jgi:hypothetical protein